MSPGMPNKILIRTIQKNCNFFCFNQNVNKSTCSYPTVKFHGINKNRFSSLLFNSNFLSPKTLRPMSAILNVNFQRNLSSNTEVDNEKQSDSSSKDSTTEDSASLLFSDDNSSLSELVNTISNSNLVKFAEDLLIDIHKETGLPWWATIAATAFGARTAITLPMAVTQVKLFLKMQAVNLEMEQIKNKLKIEINQAREKFGWPKYILNEKYNEAVKKEMEILLTREKCHPVKSCFLVVFQVPLWLSFTFATRHLSMSPELGGSSQETYAEMMAESVGWISDLTSTDQFLIFPVAIVLMNLAVIEVHQMNVLNNRLKTEQLKTLLSRALTLCLLPVAAMLPVATNIYWLSSSFYGLLQAVILYSRPSRWLFNLPTLKPKN